MVESLMYRARFVVWLFVDMIWITVLPFAWLTVYGAKDSIGGFDRVMIVSYFFFMPFMSRLTAHYHNEEIQREIKEGFLAAHLVRPIPYLVYRMVQEQGYKIFQLGILLFLMVLVYPLLRDFIRLPHVGWYLLWLLPISALSLLLTGILANILGMVSFWTTQGEWVKHFWWMFSYFVSGAVAPLSFFPGAVERLLELTPFPLIIMVPLQVLLGTISSSELVRWCFVGGFWVIVLFGLNIIMWKRGVRRFEGVGM